MASIKNRDRRSSTEMRKWKKEWTLAAVTSAVMIMSIPVVFIAYQTASSCVNILWLPLMVSSALIMVAGAIGLYGALSPASSALWFAAFRFAIIVPLLGISIVVFIIFFASVHGHGHPVPSRNFTEYYLTDFSGWAAPLVNDPTKWASAKSCFLLKNVCGVFNTTYSTAAELFASGNVSAVESGCCKPPTECMFQFLTATTWGFSPMEGTGRDDCKAWSNDQTKLCYDCGSCKAGFLANLKKRWMAAGFNLVVVLLFLVGLCAAGWSVNFQTKYAKLKHICES